MVVGAGGAFAPRGRPGAQTAQEFADRRRELRRLRDEGMELKRNQPRKVVAPTAVAPKLVDESPVANTSPSQQPGNPRRKVYFRQDGTVYYRLDPARWQGQTIRALQADVVVAEGDYLAALVDRRNAGGLGVSCWTACLLQLRHRR